MKKTINFILCLILVALSQQTKAASGWSETENSFEVWATSGHSDPYVGSEGIAHVFHLSTPCQLTINQYFYYNPLNEKSVAGSEIQIPVGENYVEEWWWVAAPSETGFDDPEHFEYDPDHGYLHTFTTINAIAGDVLMDAFVWDEASSYGYVTW